MITDEQVEAALEFMACSDEQAANLKGEVERTKFYGKRIRAHVYLSSGGTVDERKSKAEQNSETVAADKETTTALVAYETLANRRKTKALLIEVWRSQGANRRQGNI